MRFDVIIIGGGPAGTEVGTILQKAGRKCLIVSSGLSLGPSRRSEFVTSGGTLLPGDTVTGGDFEGDVLRRVRTEKLVGTALEADCFVLASGKFFSKGLISTMDRIYEPVFGCDVEYDSDRGKWVNADFFADQPFENFGVRTDECGRVSIGGRFMENLYAAGEVLAGPADIEGSAALVAEQIMGRM